MNKTKLTFKEFEKLSRNIRTVQVYKKVLADLLTPVSAWVYLSQTSKYGFLLESVEKGNQYSRYSYVGINPKKIFAHENGESVIYEHGMRKVIDQSFIDLNLWDEARVFSADVIIKNGIKSPKINAKPVNSIIVDDNQLHYFYK